MSKTYTPEDVAKILGRNHISTTSKNSGQTRSRQDNISKKVYTPDDVAQILGRSATATSSTERLQQSSTPSAPHSLSGLNAETIKSKSYKPSTVTKQTLETPFSKAENLGIEVLYTPEGLPYLSAKDVAKAEAKNVVVDADKFLSDDYKMSDAEKYAAKEYAEKYLDEYRKGMMNRTISSDQQIKDMSDPNSEYMKMNRVLNKTNSFSAAGAGLIDSILKIPDALGFSDKMSEVEKNLTGTDYSVSEMLKDYTADSETQNKGAYGAGYFLGETGKQLVTGEALNKVPAFANLQGKATNQLGKSALNILGDLSVDTLLETVPNAISDIREGASAEEVAKNAAKNIGTNAAFNVLGEGVQVGLGKLFKNASDTKIPELEKTDELAGKPVEIEQLRNAAVTPENHTKMAQNINSFVEKPLESPDGFVPTRYENGNGLTTYSDMEAYNYASSSKNHTSNEKQFSDFVRESLNGKTSERYYFGKVSDELAEDIRRSTGSELEGYNVTVNSDNIRHSLKRHGNSDVEEKLGQIAVDEDNLSLMGNVFNKPDNIVASPVKDGQGRNAIIFEKRVNGKIVVVTGISDGKHSLAIDTCYIKKAPTAKVNTQDPNHNVLNDLQGRQTGESGFFNYEVSDISGTNNMPAGIKNATAVTVDAESPNLTSEIELRGRQNESISQVSNAAENQPLPRTSKTQPVLSASNLSVPSNSENVKIPYLGDGVNFGGKVLEESHSKNIGKGRVNNVDEDVQKAFIDDPNLYTQLSNAETIEKAQQIYGSGNARSEIYRMLDQKDPAAIPLGNKLVGDLIDEGKKDEAVELLRTMSTKLRESGQFSQAAAITMIKSDPETALRYVVRNIDDMNAAGKKKFGNKWKDFELTDAEAEMFKNIKSGDTDAIKQAFESVGARLSKEYPTTAWEKMVELSRVGMLLNPRTNIRNVISNWMLQPVRSLTDRVSALGQNAIHLINPDFKVTQSITGGGKQEKQLATEVWNSVKDSLLDNTSRYEDVKGAIKDKQIFKGSVVSKAFDRIFPGAIEKANKAMGKNVDDSLLETARNFTYYLLEKGDEPFVKNNFVNRLASYMKAQGIKSIDEIPEDAIMLAKEEALKATFKDDNNFTNMLSSIKKNLGKGGEVIMPFTKTPANLAMRGVDYSPAGIVNTIKKARSGADVGRIMDDLSKNITGTAAIALGYYLTKEGVITGALSSDKDEAAFQKQQGQLAYSIKVGDNYYSYDWAQPAAIPFILGASIEQSIEESDNEEKTALEKIESIANIAHQATTSAADAWIELSPLQTISDIFDTSYGNSVPENVINEVLEFPQRFIPSALGATARTADTTQRQTYSAGNPIQTQIDTAKSKIPFLSETLPAAYDTWGREIKRSDSTGEAAFAQMINPGTLGNNVSTPIDGEIQRLYEATEDKAVFPRKSEWKVNGEQLTNKEYSELQKEQGSLSYELVETFINSSDYTKLDDSIKAETIADLYTLTKALAENSVMDKPLSSTNQNLSNIYNDQGADALVTYLQIGNTEGSGSGGALKKEDWTRMLRQSDLTNLQKAYIFHMKYPKSDNPF